MDKKKTGNLIKEARTRKNYTQRELGDLLGVTNKAVSRWENGESFPDIGILETLSKVLEIKIQDIVVGEIQSDNEMVVTEVVRLAKVQEKQKIRTIFCSFCGIVTLLYNCLIGYSGLISYRLFGDESEIVYMISLAIMLMILVYGNTLQKEYLIPRGKNISKWLLVISTISLVLVILVTCITVIMVAHRMTPLNMELYSVGPFLIYYLIIVLIINIVVLIIEFFRINKEDTKIHLGFFISVAMLHLIALYGDMLHRISTLDEVYQMLFFRTAIIILELFFAIMIVVVIKRRIEEHTR